MVIYDRYDIVFQEVPDEVSLAFTLKNCPNMCGGCHSPHLREKTGTTLSKEKLVDIIEKYKNMITCVLFLGGDADHEDIIELAKIVKNTCLKVAVYSGLDEINPSLVEVLDYYKYGGFREARGGLNEKGTNQRLLKIEDITRKMQKEDAT